RRISAYPFTSVLLFSLGFFLLGDGSAVLILTHLSADSADVSKSLRLSSKEYPLISPLVLCNVDQRTINQDVGLKKVVTNFVNQRIASGAAKDISVYLIDYKDGRWTGVNENDRYDPASMLKVPLMIAYYKVAETHPDILNQEVSFNGDDQNVGEYFRSPNDITPGHFYT